MKATDKTMETIVNLCKARGFIFPGSEIYGGLSNSWDYGPLGVEFKNNVKKAWWKKFVQESPYNVGVDAAILMNPQVWPPVMWAVSPIPSWTARTAKPGTAPTSSLRTSPANPPTAGPMRK